MQGFSLKLSKKQIRKLEKSQLQAEKPGDLSKIKRIINLLCLQSDNSISSTSAILKISE